MSDKGVAEERVLVVPGGSTADSLRSFTLPDPRTGRPQGFMLSKSGQLHELNRFKQAHSAWLTGDRLLSDGGMFIATPYDPLFALLPLLDRARDKDETSPLGKYKELDELLYDSNAAAGSGLSELLPYARTALSTSPYTAAGSTSAAPASGPADSQPVEAGAEVAASEAGGTAAAANAAAATASAQLSPGGATPAKGTVAGKSALSAAERQTLERQLACVCDVRKVDEASYYRLNDQRVLAWLAVKFRRVQAALAGQVAGMGSGHAAAYVLALLGEYVGEPWITRLGAAVGAAAGTGAGCGAADPEATGNTLQPTDPNAQANTARATPPVGGGGPPEKKQKVAEARAQAKQAALAKQAVGTKKLTSFFTKK
ncbi:hypothetical protein HYH02_004945 [Chlamydomonas schloesseri]|uniref:Ribonuclease H2 subunit B n=1 Tax=Chlamydomonas schloesseri TaxID=2026947 RepID=A0A836B8A0_9CHLO|nr:hypothetical protein HYH02_004945 [Chlamydomonas schloesseri]|eukprot:KAG2450443.1 hypothetical protein HYH02_004945 [Chlamydomonas schloesseri]